MNVDMKDPRLMSFSQFLPKEYPSKESKLLFGNDIELAGLAYKKLNADQLLSHIFTRRFLIPLSQTSSFAWSSSIMSAANAQKVESAGILSTLA